jgi:multidrug efflux pump subunit AcrA (membrane-fusion protein)
MSRPVDWWVLELESDPTPGSPTAIRGMARSWSELADDAEYAEARIRQLMGDEALGSWVGEAGDAFRSKTGDLPAQLAKCKESYRLASEALQWWANRLDHHQGDADAALVRGRAARDDLEAAQARASAAAAALSGAVDAGVLTNPKLEPTPEQVRDARARLSSARAAASSADAAVDAAQARLDQARALALDARALRQADGRAAAARIHEASDAGIPERSRWEKFKEWAGEAWDVVVTIAKVVVAVLGIVALIIGGPLAWVVFAAALLLLADSIARYLRGEGSLWDVLWAGLSCIPGTRGLTTLAALRNAYRGGGAVQAGWHVLGAGRVAITQMAASLRSMVPVLRRDVSGLAPADVWVGEGDLTLFGKDLKRVKAFADAAAQAEPELSAKLASMVADLPTSELAGFDARLKSFDSLARKVATIMAERSLPADLALSRVKDSIRYTVMTPGDEFAQASTAVTDRLVADGLESVEFKNFFGSDDYQGINTTWRDPSDGRTFEVQFHTPESFAAKTETHPWYEELRLPGIDAARQAELKRMQKEVFDAVPRPVGASVVTLPVGARVAAEAISPLEITVYGRQALRTIGYTGVGITGTKDFMEATR